MPTLEWREGGTPVSTAFDDVYFSREDGLAESRYVFLEGNNLPTRAQNITRPFHVVELGFGTGLNFLALWQAWQQAGIKTPLVYSSIEKFPLTVDEMQQAHSVWPELQAYTKPLQAAYASMQGEGVHGANLGGVMLNLHIGEAQTCLFNMEEAVDAWFLDGFAPAKNPDMWTQDIFSEIRRLSRRGTTLATFTAAGIVREGLKQAGFTIEKKKGYGRKRHMTVGHVD